jgi:hypothetical protein
MFTGKKTRVSAIKVNMRNPLGLLDEDDSLRNRRSEVTTFQTWFDKSKENAVRQRVYDVAGFGSIQILPAWFFAPRGRLALQ